MATNVQDTIALAVGEFIEDTNRVGVFVNGGEADEYTAEDGAKVPSIRKYLRGIINKFGEVPLQLDDSIVVQQPYAGSVVRSQDEKNSDFLSVEDFGAIGNGMVDDLASINKAVENTDAVENIHSGGGAYFVSSKPTNPLGKKIINGARILMNAPQGGQVQLNSYADNDKVIIGKEYMYRLWKRIEVGGTLSAFIYGDSTVATAQNGGGYAGIDFEPQNLLPNYLVRAKGIRNNVSFVNRAVGGTSIYQMNAIQDLALDGSTDLFIIKYGINDAGRGLVQFATDMRAKLAEIRANGYGTINNLTIVLMMPSATYDPQHGRASPWYEQLRGVYIQAARDYRCVLFDTYAYLRDVDWCAGFMMDNPFDNGQGVHPTSIMQNMIWAGLVDHLFTESEITPYASDAFVPCTMLNGWVSYGAGFAPAGASMSKDGWVTFRGMVKSGTTTNGTSIMQLPTGYAPIFVEHFTCSTQSGYVTIRANTNGNIEIADNGGNSTYMSISGIRYKVMG